jgi:hypothetical protein
MPDAGPQNIRELIATYGKQCPKPWTVNGNDREVYEFDGGVGDESFRLLRTEGTAEKKKVIYLYIANAQVKELYVTMKEAPSGLPNDRSPVSVNVVTSFDAVHALASLIKRV